MSQTPYIVSGIVTTPTGIVLENARVILSNVTAGGTGVSVLTNSAGEYVVDLSNASVDWAVGQTWSVYVKGQSYRYYAEFTLEDVSGMTHDVTLKGIDSYVYDRLYTLIAQQKPTGWSVFSSEPNDTAQLPCYVIPASLGTFGTLAMTSQLNEYRFEAEIEVIGSVKNGKAPLDLARNTIQNYVLSNQDTLARYGIVLNREDGIESSEGGRLLVGNTITHTVSFTLRGVVI